MDDKDLKKAGEGFRIGEDLYAVSIADLEMRILLLSAETRRIKSEIDKKNKEKAKAENIFLKK